MVAEGIGMSARLFEDPCVAPVADLIKDEHLTEWHRAEFTLGGKLLKACWTGDGRSVGVLTEEAKLYFIPISVFRPDAGV